MVHVPDSGTNDDHKCRRCISPRNPESVVILRKLHLSCLLLSCVSMYCPQPSVLVLGTLHIRSKCRNSYKTLKEKNI
jgi:hypothetical protein